LLQMLHLVLLVLPLIDKELKKNYLVILTEK